MPKPVTAAIRVHIHTHSAGHETGGSVSCVWQAGAVGPCAPKAHRHRPPHSHFQWQHPASHGTASACFPFQPDVQILEDYLVATHVSYLRMDGELFDCNSFVTCCGVIVILSLHVVELSLSLSLSLSHSLSLLSRCTHHNIHLLSPHSVSYHTHTHTHAHTSLRLLPNAAGGTKPEDRQRMLVDFNAPNSPYSVFILRLVGFS